MKSGKIISAAAAAMVFLSMSLAVFAVPPPTATLIPAPREMCVTGGEYWAKKPPKMKKVEGIPSEGYELSIRPDGMTIRYSDDAGAYYAKADRIIIATALIHDLTVITGDRKFGQYDVRVIA